MRGEGGISGLGGRKIGSLRGSAPGGKRRTQAVVIGVFGRNHLALPVGELVGEGLVPGDQFLYPLVYPTGRLVRGEDELVTPGASSGLRFGGAQRREVLAGMAAAQLGVGGDGQLALGAGGGLPVGAVSHCLGEHGLALPVGLLQGPVASSQLVLARGLVVVAAPVGGAGLGGGAQAEQAGVPGGGADLAELVPDVPGRM
jgi:hypothetical protein